MASAHTTYPLPGRTLRQQGNSSPLSRLAMIVAKARALGFTGIGLALRHRATGRVTAASFQMPGLQHPVFLRIGTGDFELCWQMLHSKGYDLDLHDPRIIIDDGANTGLSSVWFANRYPRATIYAAEMEATKFAMLDLNSAPYRNIVPIRAAVSGKLADVSEGAPDSHWGFKVATVTSPA